MDKHTIPVRVVMKLLREHEELKELLRVFNVAVHRLVDGVSTLLELLFFRKGFHTRSFLSRGLSPDLGRWWFAEVVLCSTKGQGLGDYLS